ncbi:NUDIX domain-containing protein [Candidatus Woesearchaeota archaeon]|nr:NUDIX domain-containing protein [Candidatus Woesearchaeota archaeon]
MKQKKGLIIGKFEVVHQGHVDLFTQVSGRKDISQIIAAITSNKKNIFSWEERKSMIEQAANRMKKPFVFYNVPDINNPPMYAEHVRRIIGLPSLDEVVLFTGNPYTSNCFNGKCGIETIMIKTPYSSSRLLEMIGSDDNGWEKLVPKSTKRFIYGHNGVERIKEHFNKVPGPHKFPRLATDIIIEYQGGVVLIERKNEPFGWAMPGGYHELGLSAEKNAAKEAKEETSLDINVKYLLGFYSDPKRDVRAHTASAVFVADGHGALKADDDAKDARVFKKEEVPWEKLAFDHARIIKDYYDKKDT